MHNISFLVEYTVICGTRGLKCPGDDGFSSEDKKIYDRELLRLEMSLRSAYKDAHNINCVIVAMHYPPFNTSGELSEFVEIMRKYGVKKCVYGHLHGNSFKNAVTGVIKGIAFHLVSSDYLEFVPLKLEF